MPDVAKSPAPTEDPQTFETRDLVQAVISIDDLVLSEPTVIRVKIFADDEEIRGPALVITNAEQAVQSNKTSSN